MSKHDRKAATVQRRVELLGMASRSRLIPDRGPACVPWDDPVLQRLYRDGHLKLVMLDRSIAFVGGTRTVRAFEITPFGQRWLEAQSDRMAAQDKDAAERASRWRMSTRQSASAQVRKDRERRLEMRRTNARRESLAQGLMEKALGCTIRQAQHVIDTGWLTDAQAATEQGQGLFKLGAQFAHLIAKDFNAQIAAAGNRYIPTPEIPEITVDFSTIKLMQSVPISKRLYQYLKDDRAGGSYKLHTVHRHDGGAVLCLFETPVQKDDEGDPIPSPRTMYRAIMLATSHIVPMMLMMEFR